MTKQTKKSKGYCKRCGNCCGSFPIKITSDSIFNRDLKEFEEWIRCREGVSVSEVKKDFIIVYFDNKCKYFHESLDQGASCLIHDNSKPICCIKWPENDFEIIPGCKYND